MGNEDIEIDGGKILLSLFEKYKNEPWVLSGDEVLGKVKSFFSGKWGQLSHQVDHRIKMNTDERIGMGLSENPFEFGLQCGIVLDDLGYLRFLIDKEKIKESRFRSLDQINEFFHIHNTTSIKINDVWDSYMNMTNPEIKFLQEFLDMFSNEVDKEIKRRDKEEKDNKIKEQKRLKDLKESQTDLLRELDKDGNGIIDVIEGGDDFMKLFRKHQSVIKEFDKEYINHLVKISNYLKTKRSNIQEVFLQIRKTKNKSQLEENLGLLKNQIHTYEVVLFHSLSLITSIVEDDLITVNEIYEEFDKLKMFKTDHEKEVSQKLSDIGDGLSSLMYSINSMERNIVGGLNTLSYVTQDGFSNLNSSLSRELQDINSSIETNNLLTGISTYQLYKINKQTKGLIN